MVGLGAQSTGQGHATVFPRLAAERLGLAVEQVLLREGDSDLGVTSGSSVGSRTTMTAGTALVRAVETVIEKGRRLAADILETAESDIVYRDGAFTVTGTDRRITLFELAARAKALKRQGAIADDLDTRLTADSPQTFPNGCHVAEVEIDPDTGHVQVVAYTAVDDCGRVLDHTLVEGQVHGGVAQGLGQVLLEADGVRPRQRPARHRLVHGLRHAARRGHAGDRVGGAHSPATTNPLGVKGVGEAGTTGSLAAIMNAIADAIPGGGADRDAGDAGEGLGRLPACIASRPGGRLHQREYETRPVQALGAGTSSAPYDEGLAGGSVVSKLE